MSPAAVLARVACLEDTGRSGVAATQSLLADYTTHVAALAINPDAKRLRHHAAESLTGVHPDLRAWLGRPTQARLADLSRSHAWPMICWAWVNGQLPVDLDLMLAKRQGDLYALWASAHPGDVARVAGCAPTLGWSANWTRQVSVTGLAVVALCAGGKTLAELTDDDLGACIEALTTAPSLTHTLRGHNPLLASSACTRPAISCGSATHRRGWRAGPLRPSSSCLPRALRSPRSVRSRCATSRWSRPRCAQAPWICGPTA